MFSVLSLVRIYVDGGEAVIDAVLGAARVQHVGQVAGGGSIGVVRRQAELDAVVGEHSVDAVGHGSDEGYEGCGSCDAGGAFDQPDEAKVGLSPSISGRREIP